MGQLVQVEKISLLDFIALEKMAFQGREYAFAQAHKVGGKGIGGIVDHRGIPNQIQIRPGVVI
jgi:hypothetical protein